MSSTFIVLITFIIALSIGLFLGKMLFDAKNKSEKNILDEKINGLNFQLDTLKEQFSNEKLAFEKQLLNITTEKESIRTEKDALASS